MPNVSDIGELTSIAAQYGPFLFAILFIVFVPFVGQRWFSNIIKTKTIGNDQERAETFRAYRFYWISGIVFGFVLVALSIAWWVYVQATYALPQTQDQFDKKVSADIAKRVFEGTIDGAGRDDVFIVPDNQLYKVYLYPDMLRAPMKVHFVVLFPEDPQPSSLIRLDYMKRENLESMLQTGHGEVPARLRFSLSNGPTLCFTEDPLSGTPRSNLSCPPQ